MAVGDVIAQSIPAGTLTDFQPAAGVEVMITSIGNTISAGPYALFDGVTEGQFAGTAALPFNTSNTKIMINNTTYFRMLANGYPTNFSGIQIK